MTITQLEYLVAVYDYKSFVQAAEKCFVTQPTLSMQIQKLEDELGIKIFDRSKQPILCTEVGEAIVRQARIVLAEGRKLVDLAQENSEKIVGVLHFGVIPTLAPYFLPMFLSQFLEKYPEVTLNIHELPTEEIMARLKKGTLDCGLLATPLGDNSLTEMPMFYEPFVAYVSPKSHLFHQREVEAGALDVKETWILNEGHCLRNQVINLCQERKASPRLHFNYESGSLETLKRLVELEKGITILPLLATRDFNENQQDLVRHFVAPAPVREISLVIHRQFLKKKLIDAVSRTILETVPEELKNSKERFVVPIL